MKTLNLIFRDQDKDSFNRIKSGQKLYETRAGLPEYLNMSAGDKLVISCGADTITKTIKESFHFPNEETLLQNISVEDIMPAGTTKQELIDRWNSFPNYPERIERYGIIAWKL